MEAIKPEEKQIINHVIEYAKMLGVEIKTAVFKGKSYVFTGPEKNIFSAQDYA